MKHTNQEIRWRTISEYVDKETGEVIDEKEVRKNYTIIKKTKHSHVHRTTGITTITNECRRSKQGKLFE